jgi:hypothetical protein
VTSENESLMSQLFQPWQEVKLENKEEHEKLGFSLKVP